jgi:hypothetical protein
LRSERAQEKHMDSRLSHGAGAEDGGALDVMLLGDEPTYEGREFVPLRRRGPQAAERRLADAVRAQRQP